jgi:hypothetical protein
MVRPFGGNSICVEVEPTRRRMSEFEPQQPVESDQCAQ